MAAPLASMTGSGSGAVERPLGRLEAEARSVNHRFLKTTVRAQGPLPASERLVEERLRGRVVRGHVTVTLRYVPAPGVAAGGVDGETFAAASARLAALARAAGLPPPQVADVLRVPGVLCEGTSDGEDGPLAEAVGAALDRALEALLTSRRKEGALLAGEVRRLLDRIGATLGDVEARAGDVPGGLRDRLLARLDALLRGSGVTLDDAAVAREAALLADRSDIQEEVARLRAHLEHARAVLDEGGEVGRRLDFLVQEMHREANTIGSKSADLPISRAVVDLKADVERLREQVQNLE